MEQFKKGDWVSCFGGSYTGVFDRYEPKYPYECYIIRDDGETGCGPNGEWLMRIDAMTLIYKFKPGDRVKHVEGWTGTVLWVNEEESVKYSGVVYDVHRDDGHTGGGKNGSYMTKESRIELIQAADEGEKIFRSVVEKWSRHGKVQER